MPLGDTSSEHQSSDYSPVILAQIEQLAHSIVAQRKRLDETQAQWAAKLGISQPTMARIERGDPAVAMATYVSCLWLLNPELDLTRLLQPAATFSPKLVPTATNSIAAAANAARAGASKSSNPEAKRTTKAADKATIKTAPATEHQAQIERNFAATKTALDFFKSPLF